MPDPDERSPASVDRTVVPRARLRVHAVDITLWVSSLLLAAPIVVLRYPSMGDLPFHESLVALLRHVGDPGFEPPGVYVTSLGSTNQLFHLVAAALSFVVPTDTACKLTVAASVVAVLPSGARLARHFGTNPWSALLLAPLTLGFAFRWGLVGNVIGLPILLLALPTLDRLAADPRPRRAAGAIAWMLLLYVAHESVLVVAILASAIFSLRRGGGIRQWALRGAPMAVGVALAVYYAWRSSHLKAPSILAITNSFGPGPLTRVGDVPEVLLGRLDPWLLYGVFAFFVVAFVPFGVGRVQAERARRAHDSAASPMESWRLALLGAACLVAFFVSPFSYEGSTILYQRFLPVACALLVVALAPPATAAVPSIAPILAGSTVFATLFVALPAFGEADRRFRELDAILPLIANDSAVAQLDLTPQHSARVAPIPGAGARVLAERGGRLLFSFTDAPYAPVVMAASHQWNEPVLRLVRDPLAFSPPYDFGRFRYALVRLAPEWGRLAPRVTAAMAPDARLAGESGEWLLFESTRETVPLTAPDQPLETPPTPTLRQRLAAIPRNAAP
jgi:hypothetical protein